MMKQVAMFVSLAFFVAATLAQPQAREFDVVCFGTDCALQNFDGPAKKEWEKHFGSWKTRRLGINPGSFAIPDKMLDGYKAKVVVLWGVRGRHLSQG